MRGSDGKLYGLLCKPKDDLRKDQRLMEFNTMINRALRRDAEASKRRLCKYNLVRLFFRSVLTNRTDIKTYGVTPLSEESGTIEWVEGIKPLRDILLKLYQRKGIHPNVSCFPLGIRLFLSDQMQSTINFACCLPKRVQAEQT